MIFVVTGATSFIGRNFVNQLLQNDDIVIAVCRENSSSLNVLPNDSCLSIVFSDMDSYSTLHEKITKADVFVNFAWDGTKNTNDRDFGDIHKINVINSYHAMQAAHKMGCKVFVEAGSQAEYGLVNDLITENTDCNPFTEYGKTKLEVNKQGFEFSEKTGMKYLHLRIFSVYGEDDHERTLIKTCIRKLKNNEDVDLSQCNQNWNFLYVKDAAVQIYLLCKYAIANSNFIHETYNVASEDTRQLKEFIRVISATSNSTGNLRFGAIVPRYVVSLNPDVSKTKKAIGFISNYSFEDRIVDMVKNIN